MQQSASVPRTQMPDKPVTVSTDGRAAVRKPGIASSGTKPVGWTPQQQQQASRQMPPHQVNQSGQSVPRRNPPQQQGTPRPGGPTMQSQQASQPENSSVADLKAAFEAELAPQTAKDFPSTIEPFIARLRRWKGIFQRRVDAMPDVERLEVLLARSMVHAHGIAQRRTDALSDVQRLEVLLSRTLSDANNDVEVFGQYQDIDGEPNPEEHTKIERFSVNVEVVRRPSGASPTSRRLSMYGTDGRIHHFVLETNVNPAPQRSEERATQLCRLINKFLDRDCLTRQKGLKMTVPAVIPTGQHSRLVSDDPSAISLSKVFETYMEKRGGSMDDPLMTFRKLYAEMLSARRKDQRPAGTPMSRDEQLQAKLSDAAAKLSAFEKVCNEHVSDTCLSTWASETSLSANNLFFLKKRMAESLGVSAVVCCALAIGLR